MAIQYKPLELECNDACGCQPSAACAHRCWLYEDGKVAWMLRKPLLVLCCDRLKVDVSDLVRREKADWEHMLQVIFQQSWDDCFFPSQRAHQAATVSARLRAGVDPPESPVAAYIRVEYSGSTELLFAMILSWMHKRRPSSRQRRACAMLESLLAVVVTANDLNGFAVSQLIDEHKHSCADWDQEADPMLPTHS